MRHIRKNRPIISLLTGVVFLAAFLIGGCARSPQDQPPAVKEINITYVKSPLNVPSIIEKNQQLFEKEFARDSIAVKFPELNSGAKQTEALAAGSLDFCNALGGTSAILAASNGVDLKIISIYSRAPKAFMIVVRSDDIKTISDLKGKKVGGPKGTILHQLLVTALARDGLKSEDVQFLSMDIPAAAAALQGGSIDAALLAGADANRAVNSGARMLANGEGLVEGTVLVAVRGDFLKNHNDLVERFKQVHRQSLTYIQQNPQEAYNITAQELGISVDEVKAMLPWYDFDPQIKPGDIQDLKATQDFLLAAGLQTNKINIDELIIKE